MRSGSDSAGRVVTSETRGPRFESSYRRFFTQNTNLPIVNSIEKTKIKKKRPFKKNVWKPFCADYFHIGSRFVLYYFSNHEMKESDGKETKLTIEALDKKAVRDQDYDADGSGEPPLESLIKTKYSDLIQFVNFLRRG